MQESLNKDIQWLAGIFDSEGCVASYPVSLLRVVIINCDKRMMIEASRIVERQGIRHRIVKKPSKNTKWKDKYHLDVTGFSECHKLLTSLLPFLSCKKERAQLGIQIAENRLSYPNHRVVPVHSKVFEWSAKIRELNSRGVQNPQRLYVRQDENLKIQSELHGDMQSVAEMTTPSLDWLGGFIDGDGCIGAYESRKSWHPKIGIANVDSIAIQSVVNVLRYYQLPFYVESRPMKEGSNRRASYVVVLMGYKRCQKLLPLLKDKVRIKSRQRDLLEHLVNSRLSKTKGSPFTDFENWVCSELRTLNTKGK